MGLYYFSPEEGFTEHYIRGNLLVDFGNQKPGRFDYKAEPLHIDDEYIDVTCNYYSSICFLTDLAGKISVLSPEGELLKDGIFDASSKNIFQDDAIISIMQGDVLQVYTSDFRRILEGLADIGQFIDFLVSRNLYSQRFHIDSEYDLALSFSS